MNRLTRSPGRRLAVLLAVAGSAVLLPGAKAEAAGCGAVKAAGATCTSTGTVSLAAGALTLTLPSALAWTGKATGLDQQLVDTTVADRALTAVDATGSGAGWHITVAATQFANGARTLANTGTFSLTGSVRSLSATTAPTAACHARSTCTLPTNTTTYPVVITTAASSPTPVTVYDTAASTGLGTITIGSPGVNPVGWWINVPGNTPAGTYTTTITVETLSAP
jgi:hypothetical protein